VRAQRLQTAAEGVVGNESEGGCILITESRGDDDGGSLSGRFELEGMEVEGPTPQIAEVGAATIDAAAAGVYVPHLALSCCFTFSAV